MSSKSRSLKKGRGERSPNQPPRGAPSRGNRSPETARARSAGSPARDSLVMGRNCVEELLRHAPERMQEAWIVASSDEGASGRRRAGIETLLIDQRIPVTSLTRRELDELVDSDSHQGVVVKVVPRLTLDVPTLLRRFEGLSHVRLLALDGVLDPHNMGAILRAAECFGVTGVVWSRNRGSPVSPVVSKVSVGASELLPLVPVSNLHRALEELKQSGFWLVGAAVGDNSTSLDTFEFPERCVVVMGSEGDGMNHLTEKTLDFRVEIPMMGQISSLNVSQATAVLLAELSRQHRKAAGGPNV